MVVHSFRDLQALVARISVPLNFTLAAHEQVEHGWIGVKCEAVWPDSVREGHPDTTVGGMIMVDRGQSADELVARIKAFVAEMWMHEFYEWFAVDGVLTDPPHTTGLHS